MQQNVLQTDVIMFIFLQDTIASDLEILRKQVEWEVQK